MNDASQEHMSRLLQPYGPQLPLDQLVFEVNKLYHDIEASDYDVRHPEIRIQGPVLWSEMVQHLRMMKPSEPLSILDFGCGTGFEAGQLLSLLPEERVKHLICYDPSPAMLQKCQDRIGSSFSRAAFTSDLSTIPDMTYDVLATNSLLHHLPEPLETLMELTRLLAADAVWLSGHEPSSRYYKNRECAATYQTYMRERNWRRFASPSKYLARAKLALGTADHPGERAARQAVAAGLFMRKPDIQTIDRLVDFSVAHSPEEAAAHRGFDFRQMQTEINGLWELIWVKTYSFMGDTYEGKLPRKWVKETLRLAERFPEDGANFSSVWRRA